MLKKILSMVAVLLLLWLDSEVHRLAISIGADGDVLLAALITILITPIVIPWLDE